ncbi:hypothetical protein C0993_005315 [Termitomyces sp. T159_Od127]|nr:hypothetical protein C0993_005315 [Termitomyces sp. T159_Od127]
MSDPPTTCLTVIANPDVSGIGVRTAIYAQNLLSFVPVLWALKDGRITPTELDELEKQSTTILITAFAILISTVIQAYHHGISNYHASIVLDLSWMNNTNLFIYFLLYVYHRVHLSEDEFNEEVGLSPGRARYRADSLSRWIYEANKAFKNSVIIIGSLHLSLMAAVGIWLWSHPAGFGNSGLCSLSATISVFGNQIQLGSRTLRKWSLLVYSTVSVPLLNLFIPMIIFALPFLILKHIIKPSGNVMFYSTIIGLWTLALIDIILLVDTEVAIKNNTNYFRLSGEAQWTFGQTLALLLLLVALRDLGESILHKRSKWLSDQLLKASKNGEIESVKSLLRQGANPQDACVWIALI